MKKNNLNEINLSFESAMEELENLTDKIDNDKISLKDMVNVYERGTLLVNFCNEELSKVEKKIYKLHKNKNKISIIK